MRLCVGLCPSAPSARLPPPGSVPRPSTPPWKRRPVCATAGAPGSPRGHRPSPAATRNHTRSREDRTGAGPSPGAPGLRRRAPAQAPGRAPQGRGRSSAHEPAHARAGPRAGPRRHQPASDAAATNLLGRLVEEKEDGGTGNPRVSSQSACALSTLRVDVTIHAARRARPRLRPAPCWVLAREAEQRLGLSGAASGWSCASRRE